MYTFTQRLIEAMQENQITADILSNKTKINKSTIYRYVNGEIVDPKLNNIKIIAEILGVTPVWLMGYNVAKSSDNLSKGIKIPVLGKVIAGIPLDAVQEILGFEEITKELASQGDFFGLQVKGNSMEPRFVEGDVVIVRKQSDVENGDIAVILVNGSEATIKRISKDINGITLIPFNNIYMPKFYSNKDIENLPVTILGKVVELRGKFI